MDAGTGLDRAVRPGVELQVVTADEDPDHAEAPVRDGGHDAPLAPDALVGGEGRVARAVPQQPRQPRGEAAEDRSRHDPDRHGDHESGAARLDGGGAEPEGRDERPDDRGREDVTGQGVQGTVEKVADDQRGGDQREADQSDRQERRHVGTSPEASMVMVPVRPCRQDAYETRSVRSGAGGSRNDLPRLRAAAGGRAARRAGTRRSRRPGRGSRRRRRPARRGHGGVRPPPSSPAPRAPAPRGPRRRPRSGTMRPSVPARPGPVEGQASMSSASIS